MHRQDAGRLKERASKMGQMVPMGADVRAGCGARVSVSTALQMHRKKETR